MTPEGHTARLHVGHWIGIAFLAAQILSIGYARLIPERFFSWAPYDEHTRYRIEVTVDGRDLSPVEVQRRYKYRSEAWEPRRIDNVFSIVRQYESTYGKSDSALVTVTYSTNGEEERTWRWPR